MGLPSIWENLNYQTYLGEHAFIEGIRYKLEAKGSETLKEVSRLQRRPIAKSPKWYKQNATTLKEAMALAYLSGNYSMKEIAEWFEVHYSTVSRTVKEYETNA